MFNEESSKSNMWPELPLFGRTNNATDDSFVSLGQSKLGGVPAWLQSEEIPNCPCCERPMSFLCQIDSTDDIITLADAGRLFVFVCPDCWECKAFIQSY